MRLWSTTLQQMAEVDAELKRITTADGVSYTRDELAALKGCHPELIAAVHRAKKILGGEVVSGPGGGRI